MPRPPGLGRRSVARRGQKTKMSAPRDIFDPRNPHLVPTIVSEGLAFPMVGSTVQAVNAGTAARTLLAVANTGVAGTVLSYLTNNTTPGLGVNTIPLLANGSDAGGPTSARAMKSGVTIVNRTKLLDQGGQLAVLTASQRVSLPAAPSAMTQAQWNTFLDSIVAHPRSKLYSGSDFQKSKTFINYPLDQSDYIGYQGFHGTLTVDEFWSHIAVWPSSGHEQRPMSTIFIVMETPSATNAYEVKTRSAFYTRWPLDSVPGQAHRPVPVANASVVNQHRDHAEATAHLPRGEEVAIGAGAAAAGGGAAWLINAARAAQAGAAAVGEGLELAAPLLAFAV